MELRRTATAFWRSQSPLLSFLYPSTHPPTRLRPHIARSSEAFAPSRSRQLCRCFATAPLRRQQAAAAAPQPEDEDEHEHTSPPAQQPQVSDDYLNRALDYTNKPGAASSSHTSRFKSPRAQEQNRAPTPGTSLAESATSADELEALELPTSQPAPARVNHAYKSLSELFREREAKPGDSTMHGLIPERASGVKKDPVPIPGPAPFRIGPELGRSIELNPTAGVNLGRGIQQLEMLASRNRLKSTVNQQKFHERAGLKRKRLKSQRWRKRFKEDFERVVERVVELKNKGW